MAVSLNWEITRQGKQGLLAVAKIALLLLALTPPLVLAQVQTPASDKTPHGATLSVTVNGFKDTKGQAIVAVYSSPETWLKSEKAVRRKKSKLNGPDLTVEFTDLAPGVFAVSAIHDENNNGKLDMRYFPVPRPREGAGVSNDARKALGPPSWDDAKFTVPATGYSITITLRY